MRSVSIILLLFYFPSFIYCQEFDTLSIIRDVDGKLNFADLFRQSGKLEEAKNLTHEAINLAKEKLGEEHDKFARGINLLGLCYLTGDSIDLAEKYILQAKEIRERILTKDQPSYGSSLLCHGLVCQKKADYFEAEKLFLLAKENWEKNFGNKHRHFASCIYSLANLYNDMGRFEDSIPLFKNTLAVWESIIGKNNPLYPNALNGLGVAFQKTNRYYEAELIHREAAEILKKVHGEENADHARSLNNLGVLYAEMGRVEKAEKCFIEFNDILYKLYGENHSEYATGLNNLASLYSDEGKHKDAEMLLLKALEIHKSLLGENNPGYALSLQNLAVLNVEIENFSKAEKLYSQAKEIQFNIRGAENPDYATVLHNMGNLYLLNKEYELAEKNLLEAEKIFAKIFGENHNKTATNRINLGRLYHQIGKSDKSSFYFHNSFNAKQSNLNSAIFHMSERELNLFTTTFEKDEYIFYSMLQNTGRISHEIVEPAYDNMIFRKGFLLNSLNQIKNLALTDSTSTALYNDLKSYRYLLSKEYAKPVAERKQVEEWEEKANALEKELTRTVAGFGEALQQVTWEEVQQEMRPGEAAVEFVHYRYHNPEPTDSIFYSALVLRPGDKAPHFVPLFEERDIAPLLQKASGRRDGKIDDFYLFEEGANGEELYRLIWQPLKELLIGVKKVHCSPSGLLHRINLGAIPVNDRETFADRHQLSVIGSSRQLVVKDKKAEKNANAIVFGGIRYKTDISATAAADSNFVSRSADLPDLLKFKADSTASARGGRFDYLPNTATEAIDISATLKSSGFTVELDTGYHATEEAFRQIGTEVPSPRILHIATHGYFHPDPKTGEADGPAFQYSRHPMIRSGLLMAGSRQAYETGKGPGKPRGRRTDRLRDQPDEPGRYRAGRPFGL